MRVRSLVLTASLGLAIAIPAQAQSTTQVKIEQGYVGSGPVTSGGAPAGAYSPGVPNFYVSPYAGYINYVNESNKGTAVWLNCVDYFHEVSLGEIWTANVTNLGDAESNVYLLANTRYGNPYAAVTPTNTTELGKILNLYKEAAWLTQQYGTNPAALPNQTRAIQSAIWTLFNGYDISASNVATYDAERGASLDPTLLAEMS